MIRFVAYTLWLGLLLRCSNAKVEHESPVGILETKIVRDGSIWSMDWSPDGSSIACGNASGLIYAAVTKRTLDDQNPDGWIPEQKITPEQALQAYTVNGAYAFIEESSKGSLAVGMLADFVIMSDDVTSIDPVKLKDVQVLNTYVGGEKIFDISE